MASPLLVLTLALLAPLNPSRAQAGQASQAPIIKVEGFATTIVKSRPALTVLASAAVPDVQVERSGSEVTVLLAGAGFGSVFAQAERFTWTMPEGPGAIQIEKRTTGVALRMSLDADMPLDVLRQGKTVALVFGPRGSTPLTAQPWTPAAEPPSSPASHSPLPPVTEVKPESSPVAPTAVEAPLAESHIEERGRPQAQAEHVSLESQGATDDVARAALDGSQAAPAEAAHEETTQSDTEEANRIPEEPVPLDQEGAESEDQNQRPSIAVMAFDFGTIKKPWWGEYDIGLGMADQIVNSLVNDGSFRVMERNKLDTVLAEQDFAQSDRAAEDAAKLAQVGNVLGVRYILAGSITKFATSDFKFGGGIVGGVTKRFFGPIGGLSFKKVKHEVKLTVRLIDTTTGEVVVSTQAEGKSNKGQGVGVDTGIITGKGLITFTMDSDEYRASGISEAQEKATAALVQALVQKRPRPE